MEPEHDPAVRDRVIRLMGVLRQQAAAKHRPTRHVSGHHKVLWLADAREHCAVRQQVVAGDELLRMPRVQLEPEPAPAEVLDGWIERPAPSDDLLEPALRPGLDVDAATDILWTLNHPNVWQLLVDERGWTPERWERWFADSARAQLLQERKDGRRQRR